MRVYTLNCPHCNRIIMDTTSDGGYKIRTRMLLFINNMAMALCPTCKTKIPVPLSLGDVSMLLPKPKIFAKGYC